MYLSTQLKNLLRCTSKMLTATRPNIFFTLHTHENNAFALRLKDDMKMSVVGFRSRDSAESLAQKLELNYRRKKEWPGSDLSEGHLYLPANVPDVPLSMIDINEWEFEDLKYICTSNMLDLISVEEIISNGDEWSFAGNTYSFSAPFDFYKERFNQILTLGQ